LPVSTWGEGGDLRTWSGPQIADLAWLARTAELAVLARGTRPSDRALRELLALQSSDWAFLATRELAAQYPRERARAHAAALEEALGSGSEPALRNLAPDLAGWGE
jgi:1,4-alpha-glucan branching enzyme